MKLNLGVKLFTWSMIILIASVLVLTLRVLSALELRYIDFASFQLSNIESPVRVLPLISTDDSPEVYFQYVLQIVEKLKKAGVRAVLVPIPPSTQYVPRIQSIIRKISAYDIVVFGDQLKAASPYQWMTDQDLDDTQNWWTPHPMNHLVPMFWGVSSVRVSQFGALLRFVPYQYRESVRGYTIPDVAVQVVKKYAGLSDSLELSRHFRTVSMGNYKMPVWEDGFAYVKTTMNPYYDSQVYGFVGPENNLIKFGGQWYYGGEQAVTDSTWASLAGTIVIINWPHLSSRIRWNVIGYAGAYMQVIHAILTNTFVRRYDQWNLAIIFLAIILASALVFSVRTWLAVILLTFTEVLVAFACLWLFSSHDIIYDPIYLLFTLTLCVTILPVSKVSHERKYYKLQYEMAEEHSAGLEEQLQKLAAHKPGAKDNPTLPSP